MAKCLELQFVYVTMVLGDFFKANRIDIYLNHRRRSIIKEFCLSTSTHGLPGVARAYSWKNFFFWLVSFLCFTGIMIYFIVKLILAYFQYPTQTNVGLLLQWPQYFPAYTVCNACPYRSDLLINDLINYTNSKGYTDTNDTNTITSIQASHIQEFIIDIINSNASIDNYGFSLSDMLIKCIYNNIPCSASDFIQFSSPNYGMCYTFNAKAVNQSAVRYTSYNGERGVLDLEFYIHENVYVPYIVEGTGLVSMLHDNVQVPQIEIEGKALEPGRKHLLTYTKRQVTFLPAPYTSCTQAISPQMEAVFASYNGAEYEYSQQLCYTLCLQAFTYAVCGCASPLFWNVRSVVLPGTNNLITAPLCSPNDICYSQASITITSNETLINQYCSLCSTECFQRIFIAVPSAFKSPRMWVKNRIRQFVEERSNISVTSRPIALPADWSTKWSDYIDNNYVAVQVVRGSFTVDFYAQSATLSWVDLLSNVGGQTGLWIGMSFLSLFELLETFYRLIRRQFHNQNS
ncbi:unnamed protein product [Didymodactylos carnosus]|uniref:Uncharacterized protein n=1 Tax=Didymodactylos carnosus TaxID=1234261 RepID=A0A815DNE8_9BILA|nr:unnamed protein product [Didymodactylos carnosus]CAF1303870.1 unnamed protein product [Didymodactylos carnosus]CAF3983560.1 unnamed protein product [Didymodactylos carnosus]CAF4133132.1 unnamed protein product [Didymodactylos carnosus]